MRAPAVTDSDRGARGIHSMPSAKISPLYHSAPKQLKGASTSGASGKNKQRTASKHASDGLQHLTTPRRRTHMDDLIGGSRKPREPSRSSRMARATPALPTADAPSCCGGRK